MTMFSCAIIVWNRRGAESQIAFRHLVQLIRSNDPDILIFLETRFDSSFIWNVEARIKFNKYIVSQAHDFTKGIRVLHNDNSLHVQALPINE